MIQSRFNLVNLFYYLISFLYYIEVSIFRNHVIFACTSPVQKREEKKEPEFGHQVKLQLFESYNNCTQREN